MENPYIIFNLSQNASKKEIQEAFKKAQIENRRNPKYSGSELLKYYKSLLSPHERLAADFLFPKKLKSYRPKQIDKLNTEIINSNLTENIFYSFEKMLKHYEKK